MRERRAAVGRRPSPVGPAERPETTTQARAAPAEEELRFQKTLLEAQSEAAQDGILVVSSDRRMISFNHRFVEMWDIPPEVATSRSDDAALRSVEDKLADPASFYARVQYLYDHPDQRSHDEIRLRDGRILDRHSAPVTTPDGLSYGRVWSFRDVTAERRMEESLRFLAGAGEVLLSSSLDYEATLNDLACLLVPGQGDWCAMHLLEGDGSLRQVALVHPCKADLGRALQEKYPPRPDDPAVNVRRTGKAELYPEIPDKLLARSAYDAEHLRLLRELGLKSAIIAPLRGRHEILGSITLVSAESGRRYDESDLALIEEVGRRAGLAVENARLFTEAQRSQQELRLANEAKDEFLGMMSHELRTPVTTIFGGARLLRARGGELGEENQQELLADMEQEAERLYRIVENLLVLARVEAGSAVETQPVLLPRLAEKVAAGFTQRRTARRVVVNADADVGPVDAAPTYVEQILRNLLSNADKYSPADSPIEITMRQLEDHIEVSVLDRGAGVAPGEAERIFERFYRSERTAPHVRGTGIGLTVCRRLVEAQGGQIWAHPREGGGLEATLSLPIPRPE